MAVDFFKAQDQARRNTKLLVLLFGVRPLLSLLRGKTEPEVETADDDVDVEQPAEQPKVLTADALREQVALARQLATE